LNTVQTKVLIDARDLTRTFGTRLAVDKLSMRLCEGELLALLGPNGAGKTTTMRMLSGLLAPSTGSAEICGHPLGKSEAANAAIRAQCGIAPEAAGFYERLSARDNLRFFGGLQGMSSARIEARSKLVLDRFNLTARADELTGTYSKGMKQRLSLARALLHEPRLLFLDEPTAGLDPLAAADVHQLIRELKAAGVGIVLSTHSLDEAEMLAEEVLVLDTRTRFQGRAQALGRTDSVVIEIRLSAPPALAFIAPVGVSVTAMGALHWVLAVDDGGRIADVVRELLRIDAAILSVSESHQNLRDRYLSLFGKP